MELLSKKELLKQTGISYGQLYRWKREGLIPESWFQKQASPTGQETFFPRQQMLQRVAVILKLKPTHSLSELRAMLSPHTSATQLSRNQLARMGVQGWLVDAITIESVSFIQVVYLHLLGRVVQQGLLPRHMAITLLQNSLEAAGTLTAIEQTLTVFVAGSSCHVLFTQMPGLPLFDSAVELVAQYNMSEAAEQLKPKYNKLISGQVPADTSG